MYRLKFTLGKYFCFVVYQSKYTKTKKYGIFILSIYFEY